MRVGRLSEKGLLRDIRPRGTWAEGALALIRFPLQPVFYQSGRESNTTLFPAGGGLGLAENVTEEVQSLRNRVELLEKVRFPKREGRKKKHRKKEPPPTLMPPIEINTGMPQSFFEMMPDAHGFMNANTCSAEMWKQYSNMLFCFVVFFYYNSFFFLPEQKLQLVLAPFSSFFPLSLDEGWSEKTTLLSHSFQQLDRIDSLSEQIGFLEERLGTCE